MATPSRGSTAFSVRLPEKCVKRSPPVKVNHFAALNWSSRKPAKQISAGIYALVELLA